MTENESTLLKEEYIQLQKTVEDFDQRALTVKAWSVTTSMAGIAGSFFHDKAAIVALLAALASLAFWMVEALWKEFQQCYYPRMREIEAAFRNDAPTAPMQICEIWSRTYHSLNIGTFFKVMTWPHVAFPHVFVLIVGCAIWAFRIWYSGSSILPA